VDEVPLHEIGPMVEHHPMFPKRVNFEIVNLIDSGRVKARVWERGSGLTEACGTGACAIGVVGLLSGRTRSDLEVALPGGDLRVQWDGRREVVMEGPIQSVFDGEWPD
jgi:diaminopimelate epimerase